MFAALLSLNVLLFVLTAIWFSTLPRVRPLSGPPTPSRASSAHIDLTIGPAAINTYLAYALTEQPDIRRVVQYVKVAFAHRWDIQLGVKLAGRVIPCRIALTPEIHQGNLWLPVNTATVGGVSVPKSILFFLFSHAPWPAWIVVDPDHQQIEVNLTKRPSSPKSPYRIRAVAYSAQAKAMTFQVGISPLRLP